MANNPQKVEIQEFTFGSNELKAKELFEGRKVYKKYMFPADTENLIDSWYDRQNYGKIDSDSNAIFISETNLKQIPSPDTVFVADFVADAFNDLLNFYELAKAKNAISPDGPLANLVAVKGWESVSSIHHEMMSQIYTLFTTSFLQLENRAAKITDFSSFMSLFLQFLGQYGDILMATRSAYIFSNYCPSTISGLMIDIKEAEYSSDEIKKKIFIDDPNFNFYKSTAQKYGFLIDRNIPWRLVANLTSTVMKKYMSKRGVVEKSGKITELFQTYYYQSFFVDIDILKNYLLQMYNSFVASYPFVKEIKSKCSKTSLSSLKKRDVLTDDIFNFRYGDMFWLKNYLEIRVIETKKNWNREKINILTKKAMELYNSIDFDAALIYINDVMKNFS